MIASLAFALALGTAYQDAEADPAGDALVACAPATLDAAFVCLDAHWTSRDEFRALAYDDIIMAHFGVGMWMRNNWGLWGGGPLAQHFNAQGIQHPDDMSGIILTSYWLHLHGCPTRLDEQIGYYKAFWARESDDDMPGEPNLDCTAQQGATAQ